MKKGKKMSKNKLHEYSIGGVMKAYELGGMDKPKLPGRKTGWLSRWKLKRHKKKTNCLRYSQRGECVQPMP